MASVDIRWFDTPKTMDTDKLSELVKSILHYLSCGEAEISILFCSKAYIAELNSAYRQINAPTDVLSFSQAQEMPFPLESQINILGDIVISPEIARENAIKENEEPYRELIRLIIHGTLHLLGMEHATIPDEKSMQAKQEQILQILEKESLV